MSKTEAFIYKGEAENLVRAWIETKHIENDESFTEESLAAEVNDYLKKCNEMQAEEDYSLETGTAVYNKESEKVRMCSDGLYRGKYRKAEREQVNNELVPTHSEKQVSSAPLSVDTIARFRSLYAQYPEQINYRIKFGSAMEKAQATVIRNIAVGAVAVE